MAGRFETLLDGARSWLNTPSGVVDQLMTFDDLRVRLRELARGVADLLGEAQPCGFEAPRVSRPSQAFPGRVCIDDAHGDLVFAFDPSEARAYAAMLLRAADEAEGASHARLVLDDDRLRRREPLGPARRHAHAAFSSLEPRQEVLARPVRAGPDRPGAHVSARELRGRLRAVLEEQGRGASTRVDSPAEAARQRCARRRRAGRGAVLMPDWKNHPVVEVIAEGVRALVRQAWEAITGDEDAPELTPDIVERITDRVLATVMARFGEELRARVDELALRVGLLDLSERAEDVLDAFKVKGEFPRILDGAQVEIEKE